MQSMNMARPPKKPADRKAYHLRVPLAANQRTLIEEAARLADADKAAWARAILLEAARKRLAKRKTARATADAGDGREEEGAKTPTR
jgi:hypothetical protein